MSNMLRGSLTSTTDAKGVLGFKGERGYSNYELYVKNGGTMTEQEWLDHFGVDLTGYCKTSEMTSYVNTTTGDLEELETTDKTDLVSAINELNTNINSLDDRDNYSTTEQVVGTWIDGKPIYRKTIAYTGTALSSGTTSIQHNISNIGTHRQIVASEFWYNNNMWNGFITTTSYCTVNAVHSNSIDVSVSNDFAGLFSPVYITLEYTKTTD